MERRLPALFIAHGSPMNVLMNNSYTKALAELGKSIDKPKAILVISAHWQTNGTYINSVEKPKQIYDFYGFPEELYDVKYEPNGGKEYADILIDELSEFEVKPTESWGLDHGAWGILKHIYPKQDIPAFQMSINRLGDEKYHYNLGKKLRKLRDEGILVIGSGDIVHNLSLIDYDVDSVYEWAQKFDQYIINGIQKHDHNAILEYKRFGAAYKLSVPTDEHFVPLIYILGMEQEGDKVEVIHQSIQNGSISMTSFGVF